MQYDYHLSIYDFAAYRVNQCQATDCLSASNPNTREENICFAYLTPLDLWPKREHNSGFEIGHSKAN